MTINYLGESKLIFWSSGKAAKKLGEIGPRNKKYYLILRILIFFHKAENNRLKKSQLTKTL